MTFVLDSMKNYYRLKFKNFLQKEIDTSLMPDSTAWQMFNIDYREYLDPDFLTKLTDKSIIPEVGFIFKGPPRSIQPIHIDGYENETRKWAINIAWGSSEYSMKWYKIINNKSILRSTQVITPYLHFDKNNVEEIDKVNNMSFPTLIRTDVPHSVENYSNNFRYSFTLRGRYYYNNWNIIVKALSPYIDYDFTD
jgi:hypothetical protein